MTAAADRSRRAGAVGAEPSLERSRDPPERSGGLRAGRGLRQDAVDGFRGVVGVAEAAR
ncbi:MAG: hypothetical protein R3E53_05495 [Myxococcota bacterium]